MTNNLPVPANPGDHFPSTTDFAVALHGWLDGSSGTNRNRAPGAVLQIEADTDHEAIEAWLTAKSQMSPHTQRSYRREAYRLLAWSMAFKDKPLSSLTVSDIRDFNTWLAEPESHPAWKERGWVLFRGKLSGGSQRQAIVILLGMFNWLVDAGYLAGNPVKLCDAGAAARAQKEENESEQERFLPHEIWEWIQDHMDDLRPANNRGGAQAAYERKRFILTFLYWTGMRRSELATAVMGGISNEGDRWTMKIKGKGRKKLEKVTLTPSAMDALRRYRTSRGLSPLPSMLEKDLPVVPAIDGTSPISDAYINSLLKDLMERMALLLDHEHSDWAGRLRMASAHWMRHSFATHSAEAGMSMQSVADQLRHKSMDTTRRIYTHVAAKHRGKELDKLEKYNKTERQEELDG